MTKCNSNAMKKGSFDITTMLKWSWILLLIISSKLEESVKGRKYDQRPGLINGILM